MRPRGQGEDATNCAGVSKIRAKNIVFFTGESVTRKEAGDCDARADFQHLSLLQSREIHHEMAKKNALRGDSCLTDAPRLALLSHSLPPESHYFLANAALRSIASRPAFGRVPSRVRLCLVPRSLTNIGTITSRNIGCLAELVRMWKTRFSFSLLNECRPCSRRFQFRLPCTSAKTIDSLNTKIPGEDGAFLGDFYGVVFRKNYLFALFK